MDLNEEMKKSEGGIKNLLFGKETAVMDRLRKSTIENAKIVDMVRRRKKN